MVEFTLDECLDLLEEHYQYKHSTQYLVDFRALTYKDGDVYIEYRMGRKQYNVWVNMNHSNLLKRVNCVSDIEETYVTDVFDNVEQPISYEYDWGEETKESAGEEVW